MPVDPPGELRALLDPSTYLLNNLGDDAMLLAAVGRLRSVRSDVVIEVVTADPGRLRRLDPTLVPLMPGDRSRHRLPAAALTGLDPTDVAVVDASQAAARRDHPERYWAAVEAGRPGASAAGAALQAAARRADVVVATGGGWFTDAFAEHATGILTTIEDALDAGIPAFVVGAGIEPVDDPILRAAAARVLPRVSAISCREGLIGPGELASHGVAAERVSVAGDDALVVAAATAPASLGGGLGVSLRDHSYNRLSPAAATAIRRAVATTAERFGAPVVAVPISTREPSDAATIAPIVEHLATTGRPAGEVTTVAAVLEQLAVCRVVLAGSYHAAVFALATGASVVALGASPHYRHKLAGLLDAFELDPDPFGPIDLADADADVAERIEGALAAAWDGAADLRPHLLARARDLVAASDAAWRPVLAALEGHRPVVDPRTDGVTVPGAVVTLIGNLLAQATATAAERDHLAHHAQLRLDQIHELTAMVEELRG